MGGQLGFLYRQLTFKPKPIPPSIRLEGKTAIITGANVGLGLEAAKELAAHGLTRLIIAARDVSKAENGKKAILGRSPKCDVHVWKLDYESFDSIKNFGERARTLDRLDIVILSAGVKYLEYIKSKTGHEAHVQVGNFLLHSSHNLTYISNESQPILPINPGQSSWYRRPFPPSSRTSPSNRQINRSTEPIDNRHIRGAFLD